MYPETEKPRPRWPGQTFRALLFQAADYLSTHPNLGAKRLAVRLYKLARGL